MRHLFVSQSLYKKPKSSEEDISRAKDAINRLTDPKKFPMSHRLKHAESKRERDSKLAARSNRSLGSLNSIAQSNSSILVPEVFLRLAASE